MTNGVTNGAESGAESGLKSLGPRLQELVRHIQDDVHAAGKAAAKAALREAVLGTPVKTGRARANWQVGQGNRFPALGAGGGYPETASRRPRDAASSG